MHVLFVELKHFSEELHMRLCSLLCIDVLKSRQISSLQVLVHKDECLGLDWSVAPDWNQNGLQHSRLHDLDLGIATFEILQDFREKDRQSLLVVLLQEFPKTVSDEFGVCVDSATRLSTNHNEEILHLWDTDEACATSYLFGLLVYL